MMKKVLVAVLFGLVWCNTSFAGSLKIYHADENSITTQETWSYTKELPIAVKHCAKYKKFVLDIWDSDKQNKKTTIYCVSEYYSTFKGKPVKWTNYDANSDFVKNKSMSSSSGDKIAQSKQICRDLGFKTNTEKFADCALKMMSLQFTASNKVASSGGTTQKIIIDQGYDVWDAMINLSGILSNNSSSSSSSGSNCRIVQKAWGADMYCN